MGVQVPHCVYAQVQEKSDLWRSEERYTGVYQNAVQVQGCRDNRRTYDERSCPSVAEYTTENECVKLHGIPEGEERTNDIRVPCKPEIQVWKSTFLGGRLLCINCGVKRSTIKKYIADQDKHDIALDKLSVKEYEDPFKGGK